MFKLSKRKKPYTVLGLCRVSCARCGEPSTQQWQICALDNCYYGVCTECDLELNNVVLKFMRINPLDYTLAIIRYMKHLGLDHLGTNDPRSTIPFVE